MDTALIIFVRNPVLGKVKSRLAATTGNEIALQIYEKLLNHTHDISRHIPVEKFVFYEDYINNEDLWENVVFNKFIQEGNELGERMSNAFRKLFNDNYGKVVILGSDCFELTETIIRRAIELLAANDLVVGPAADGGYYLLGMNQFIPALFRKKKWSTDTVYKDTIDQATKSGLSIADLPILHDVDYESDIRFI